MKWGQAGSFFKMYSSGGKNEVARTLSLLQYLQRLSRYSTVQSSRYYPKTFFSSPHHIPFYHNKCVVHAWHNVTVWCMYIIVQYVHTPHHTQQTLPVDFRIIISTLFLRRFFFLHLMTRQAFSVSWIFILHYYKIFSFNKRYEWNESETAVTASTADSSMPSWYREVSVSMRNYCLIWEQVRCAFNVDDDIGTVNSCNDE